MNHADRVRRLLAGLDEPLLVSSLVNIRYLTGFTGSNAYLYATPDGCTFITDGRYGEVAGGLVADLPDTKLLVYRTGLYDRLAEVFAGAASVALESDHITWAAQRALAQRHDGGLTASSGVVEALRAVKDADEIAALRAAAKAGDRAFDQADALAASSSTEAEMAEALVTAMERHGGRRASWEPIVAVGANASRPHHETGETETGSGLLLLDYGCVVDGYHSDMSRTIWIGDGSDDELERVYDAVLASNLAGIEAVKPGGSARDVDAVCREVLEERGLAEYFVHSTGHGVGLEIHEGPSANTTSKEILEPGHVLTVEPGVYLEGRLGVRIEDMVLVTESGHEVLTLSSKELRPG
jgi:Xaa-Pro aminopeptidase